MATLKDRLAAFLTTLISKLNSLNATKANKTTKITGTGSLTGGGNLSANRTLDLSTTAKADITKGVTAHGWGDFREFGIGRSNNLTDLNSVVKNSIVSTSNQTLNRLEEYGSVISLGGLANNDFQLYGTYERTTRLFLRRQRIGELKDWVEVWTDENLPNPATESWVESQGYLKNFDGLPTPNLNQVTSSGNVTSRTIAIESSSTNIGFNRELRRNKPSHGGWRVPALTITNNGEGSFGIFGRGGGDKLSYMHITGKADTDSGLMISEDNAIYLGFHGVSSNFEKGEGTLNVKNGVYHDGELLLDSNRTRATISKYYYIARASISTSDLLQKHNGEGFTNSIDDRKIRMKVFMAIENTARVTGNTQLVEHDGTQWVVTDVGVVDRVSNSPFIVIENGLPRITLNHTTNYNIIVYVEYIESATPVDLFNAFNLKFDQLTGVPTEFPPSAHSHPISQVTGLQSALDGKENSFSKNTAFNKNFGTGAGTVAQGNDSRIVEAFKKKVNAISFTGDTNKTLTVTREDGSALTASFLDNNDPNYPDDVLNTLTFNLNDDGVLRAVTSEGNIISVSLDGRYALLTDSRMTNSREWTASTVSQAEAQAGTATTRRAWTAQRVRQAISAWWATVESSFDLHAVTSIGNETNNSIYVGERSGDMLYTAMHPKYLEAYHLARNVIVNGVLRDVKTRAELSTGGIDVYGYNSVTTEEFYSFLKFPQVSENANYRNRYIPVSVNGEVADRFGNIELDVNPGVQDSDIMTMDLSLGECIDQGNSKAPARYIFKGSIASNVAFCVGVNNAAVGAEIEVCNYTTLNIPVDTASYLATNIYIEPVTAINPSTSLVLSSIKSRSWMTLKVGLKAKSGGGQEPYFYVVRYGELLGGQIGGKSEE